MQVAEEITTGDSIKDITKEILKSKITSNEVNDYLNYVSNKNKTWKQIDQKEEHQNDSER